MIDIFVVFAVGLAAGFVAGALFVLWKKSLLWRQVESASGEVSVIPPTKTAAPHHLGSEEMPLWLPPFHIHTHLDVDQRQYVCRLHVWSGSRLEYRCRSVGDET